MGTSAPPQTAGAEPSALSLWKYWYDVVSAQIMAPTPQTGHTVLIFTNRYTDIALISK